MLGEIRYVKRPHPPGPEGIRTSLREVALKGGEGRHDQGVIVWTRRTIELARLDRGIRADTPRKRAEVLLGELQSRVWTPDPSGVELIPAARLLACDVRKDKDCIGTDDCDGKTVALVASALSVDVPTVIVGHSYREDRSIGHVLSAMHLDGAWHYADPTLVDEPIGSVVPFTYERVLEPFTGKVLCEGKKCLATVSKDILEYVPEGQFVGLGLALRRRTGARLEWLGDQKISVLGQQDADYSKCLDETVRSKLDTAAEKKAAFRRAAECAADAYCAAQGVPPGLCSQVAGPVADKVAEIWSDIFGCDTCVDCSRHSQFRSECHPCTLIKAGLQFLTNPASYPPCAARLTAEKARIANELPYAASGVIADQYNSLLKNALTQIAPKLRPGEFPLPKLRENGLIEIPAQRADPTTQSRLVVEALYSVAPAYKRATGQELQSKYLPPPRAFTRQLSMPSSSGSGGGSGGGALLVGLLVGGGILWALA